MIKAQNNYVILTQVQKSNENKTESGIILPTIVEDKDTTGWANVHAASEGSKYKPGDLVIFNKYVPVQFVLEKVQYLAVKETDIIAIL